MRSGEQGDYLPAFSALRLAAFGSTTALNLAPATKRGTVVAGIFSAAPVEGFELLACLYQPLFCILEHQRVAADKDCTAQESSHEISCGNSAINRLSTTIVTSIPYEPRRPRRHPGRQE